jgi:hypothetical protein
MPCLHKFHEYLNLDGIDFVPTTLIVGTFNPIWPEDNPAEWFYGRIGNNYFWDVLPRVYGQDSLIDEGHLEWKSFCSVKGIAITDFISCIEDACPENPQHIEWLGGFGDDVIATNFYDFDLVNIVRLLRNNPTITNVYITRSITNTFWKHKAFPLIRYCQNHGVRLTPLITPSGYAYFQQGRHNRLNPNNQLNLPEYILMRWQEVWQF